MSILQERKRRIFLDMDGVVVDLVAEFCRRFSICPTTFASGHYSGGNDEFWKIFDTDAIGFFRVAPPFAGSRDFIERVFVLADEYGYDVEMLTALPRKITTPLAEREKNEWMLSQKYSRHVPVKVGPYAIQKQNHAVIGDVLCDDNDKNIAQWIAKGCVGILHTSHEQSLEELEMALKIQDCRAKKFYQD